MKTIHKYPLTSSDHQTIHMPSGEKIIHIGLDPQGIPCIWAEVDTSKPKRCVNILIFATGEELPDHGEEHLGSFVRDLFVWHVYA